MQFGCTDFCYTNAIYYYKLLIYYYYIDYYQKPTYDKFNKIPIYYKNISVIYKVL